MVRSNPELGEERVGPGLLTERGFEGRGPLDSPIGADRFAELAGTIEEMAESPERSALADTLGGLEGFARLQTVARLILSAEAVPLPLPSPTAPDLPTVMKFS